MIPIYTPYLSKYKTSALKAIADEWISNHGIYMELAADELKKLLNVNYCILMNNGTSATHCLFKALKYKYPDIDRIYVPNNVFIAPWNCVLLEYPIECIEVMKTNSKTMNIDTSEPYIMSLEYGSAVLIVHNLGNIVNVPRLKRLRPDLIFVEDNCEGFLGKYEGIYSGTSDSSLCSANSFYGNKIITTGEGGAFVTNDIDVYKYIKTFHSHGMSDERYIHNMLGTNYRMTNVEAGFLYDQLKDIDHILCLKRSLFKYYEELFSSLNTSKVIMLDTEDNVVKADWMFVLILPSINYKDFEKYMLERQVQVRPFFYDIHKHNHLVDIYKHDEEMDTKVVENITDHGVMLPSYPGLTEDEQKYIFNCVKEYLLIY